MVDALPFLDIFYNSNELIQVIKTSRYVCLKIFFSFHCCVCVSEFFFATQKLWYTQMSLTNHICCCSSFYFAICTIPLLNIWVGTILLLQQNRGSVVIFSSFIYHSSFSFLALILFFTLYFFASYHLYWHWPSLKVSESFRVTLFYHLLALGAGCMNGLIFICI